jgi:hypothetical protein
MPHLPWPLNVFEISVHAADVKTVLRVYSMEVPAREKDDLKEEPIIVKLRKASTSRLATFAWLISSNQTHSHLTRTGWWRELRRCLTAKHGSACVLLDLFFCITVLLQYHLSVPSSESVQHWPTILSFVCKRTAPVASVGQPHTSITLK